MQRLWLIFSQAVTIALAALFVVGTLKPEWFPRRMSSPSIQTTALPSETSVAGTGATHQNITTSYASAARAALPSVVHVFTSKDIPAPRTPLLNDPFFQHFFGIPEQPQQRVSGLGSGVLVSKDGFILTNNHVIETADAIEVALNDGRKYRAHIVGRDPESDIAVLRIESRTKLSPIEFAPADSAHVGDIVLAIGNPFGVGQTVTLGIVSALERSQLGINAFENFIQTDAAINPGNSGGALVDTQGRLVGINTAIYSRSGGGSLGIGFAIPAAAAQDVMEQIIKTGRMTRGWIGVQVQEITPDLVASYGFPGKGALIAGIARNSPADKGGLLPGDVILEIDGKDMRTAQDLLKAIAARTPGQLAKLTLVRKSKTLEAVIQIAQRPLPPPTNSE